MLAGLTGPSASGKTYLISLLHEQLKEDLCVLSLDMYYWPREMQAKDAQGYEIFDIPQSINQELFMQHLHDLMEGKTIRQKRYTYNLHDSSEQYIEVKPAPLILVEGIFIPGMPELDQLLQYRIYLDAPYDLRLQRRLERDQRERGYSPEEIHYRYQMHMDHAVSVYLESWQHKADLVITNSGELQEEAGRLAAWFKAQITH